MVTYAPMDPDVVQWGSFVGPLLPGQLVQGPGGIGIQEPDYLPGQSKYRGGAYIDPNAAIDRLLAGKATTQRASASSVSLDRLAALNSPPGTAQTLQGGMPGLALLALAAVAVIVMRRR